MVFKAFFSTPPSRETSATSTSEGAVLYWMITGKVEVDGAAAASGEILLSDEEFAAQTVPVDARDRPIRRERPRRE
jgi:hypothetical protein